MKIVKNALLALVLVGSFSLPAGAVGVGNATGARCLCLAGLLQPTSGVIKGGPACIAPVCTYFSVRIFDDNGYNAGLTQAARYTSFLTSCPYAGQISAAFGQMFTLGGC